MGHVDEFDRHVSVRESVTGASSWVLLRSLLSQPRLFHVDTLVLIYLYIDILHAYAEISQPYTTAYLAATISSITDSDTYRPLLELYSFCGNRSSTTN
jgi:hypothetical protein